MSNSLPAAVSKTMPINAVVDYSGQISQTELGTLQSYASRMHYCPHVVLLPPSAKNENTQTLSLQMAKAWNLEPNGFLLVVNPASDTAAMVAGTSLQNKGITGKYINTHLMPQRFEKEYALGNTYGAIRTTMGAVEHKLNAIALQGQPNQVQHHSNHNFPVGIIFISFFFFFAFIVYFAGKNSLPTRRMRLDNNGYGGDSDLSADVDRIHQLMGDGPASKQVSMKEFAQRASIGRNTQSSLEALPVPEHESEFPHRSSTHLIDAPEKPKSLKLIFEGTHTGEKFAVPTKSGQEQQQEQELPVRFDAPSTPASAAASAEPSFAVPTFKPYEFPEDETVIPSVSSLQPVSDVSVPNPDPGLIAVAASAALPSSAPVVASPTSTESNQTTENTFKVDQYAQAMTSEPDQAAGLAAWTPATYTMPPAPVMPTAPSLPVSHFNNSFSNDFADMLSNNGSSYGLGVTPITADSPSSGKSPSAGVCPQCQSEKSPDFSFCLRCGHMFV